MRRLIADTRVRSNKKFYGAGDVIPDAFDPQRLIALGAAHYEGEGGPEEEDADNGNPESAQRPEKTDGAKREGAQRPDEEDAAEGFPGFDAEASVGMKSAKRGRKPK